MASDDDDFVHFFRPAIGQEEIDEVVSCLKSGWLTTASQAKRFEADFAAYVGAKHAIAVNSCTAALHLALEAHGLRAKEVVLVPTLTFAATAEVVQYFGAYPLLVDCREEDFNIDVDHAARLLDDLDAGRPVPGLPSDHGPARGIIPVHFGGQPVDMPKLLRLARSRGLFVVDDAAHCCPAYYRDGSGQWRMVGAESDVCCFSFYANKAITTGEGGMITTADAAKAERMRVMSLHGISKDAWKRFTRQGSWYYEIHAPGFKYNMSDVLASIGIHQLAKADQLWRQRQEIATFYQERLGGVAGLALPKELPDRRHCWHLYVVRLLPEAGVRRDDFIERMKAAGVGTSVHYMPLHLHPFYRERYQLLPEHFPVASRLFGQIVSMPLYPGMTPAQLEKVVAAAKAAIAGG